MRDQKRFSRGVSRRSRSEAFQQIAHRLTERDVSILLDLYEHGVLTTRQISHLHFTSERVARRRLTKLCAYGVIWGYRPHRERGSHPFHYLLLRLGALVVASRLDTDLRSLAWNDELPSRLAKSRKLAHRREVNGFFAALAHACKRHGDFLLAEWWSERSAARGLPLAPDGIGRIRGRGIDLRFFYEHDRSTENHAQLAAKVSRYRQATLLDHAPRILLVTFLTEQREREARPLLHIPGLTVATAVYEQAMTDSLGEVWQPIGQPLRCSLLDLKPPPDTS